MSLLSLRYLILHKRDKFLFSSLFLLTRQHFSWFSLSTVHSFPDTGPSSASPCMLANLPQSIDLGLGFGSSQQVKQRIAVLLLITFADLSFFFLSFFPRLTHSHAPISLSNGHVKSFRAGKRILGPEGHTQSPAPSHHPDIIAGMCVIY